MQEQIEAKKRLLIVSKPIGQRLDNTRAASQRALKRLEQAKVTAWLAQEVLAAAEMESANLAKELQDLEAEVAANTSANDVEMQDSAACNPIACLEKQLAATGNESATSAAKPRRTRKPQAKPASPDPLTTTDDK